MQKYIQVITTVKKKKTAREIAQKLLEKRAAACVQIAPVRSSYWWNDKIEHAKEFILIIKGKDFKKIGDIIKENHPYKVPEIISLQIAGGNKDYLDWIDKETR